MKSSVALLICVLGAVTANIAVAATEDTVSKKQTNEAVSAQDVALAKTYDNKASKYSIKYPAEWIYDDSAKGAVVFSGKKDTIDYFSTVNIQTVLAKKSGGEYASVNALISDVKKQALKESPHTTFLENGLFDLKLANGSVLSGIYMTFIYTYQGQIIQQWQIAVPRKDGKVFYTWAYTAPIDQFSHNYLTAKAMLATWSIY